MANNEASSVYTMSEINLESCTFMKPEKLGDHNESYITVDGSRGFVLQSPKLVLRTSTPTYFEFLVSRNKDRHREFYNIISHLEDSAIIQIAHNSKEWFNREFKRDQIDTMFRSIIHRPLEIDDPYILRIKKVPGLEAEINYQVICLIKIDGIWFGKNTSTLDMKVVQIKVIKTEKLPSEDGYADQVPVPSEKPFYNDNASVVPHNFSDKDRDQQRPAPLVTNLPIVNEEQVQDLPAHGQDQPAHGQDLMVEKVDELHYVNEETQQLDEIEKTEQLLEQNVSSVHELVHEPPSPVKSVKTVRTVRTELPVQSPVLSVDSIKCEIMKAMSDNDFQRVKELGTLLQKHKIGSV